jgi:ribosome-associated translation inhibitor RaiA
MTDSLELFLTSLEADVPLFTITDLRRWPASVVERLVGLGLLCPTTSATHVACPECDDGHVEEVVPREGDDGKVRFFIRCPEALRVEVPEELLRQWTVDLDALAAALAKALTLKGHPKALVPGRLWRLGKTPWQGANREVLFARGLGWPDSSAVACHVGPNGRPIILVADQAPPDTVWTGRPPATIVLAQVAALGASGIEIDAVDVAARVNEADQRVATVMGLPVTAVEQKRVIRQQVKAEVKAHLEDDVLVAAYKEWGSYREAADALTQQLGRKISKDKVRRAVLRAGGLDEVAQTANSPSVQRTVASQRRDGRKIIRKSS